MHGGAKCMVVRNAWRYEMHGGTKWMVVRNAWWYKMHGGTKCMVVQNAWWYEMHGGTKCMVVQNAWWYKMHGVRHLHTKTNKDDIKYSVEYHARTRRGRLKPHPFLKHVFVCHTPHHL
jgi:hypothetical protein